MDLISTWLFMASDAGLPDFWIATLGEGGYDYGSAIAVDGAGNVYVCGQTNSDGAGSDDFLIAKYDTNGTIQWQRTLGGAFNDFGYAIAVDGANNVYVCGLTGANSLIAKYDTNGTIQWQRTLGVSSSEDASAIAVDGAGNVYVSGYISSVSGNYDCFIAKLPDDGSLTGTYGAFTYQESALTSSTSNLTSNTSALTSSTSNLTSSTSNLTSNPSNLASTTIPLN